MVKNKTTILIFSLLLVLLAYLVMAASEGMKIISPASGTNYSSTAGVLFNVSYINGIDITSPANATFYINLSGTWSRVGNTPASDGCSINSCAVTITNTTIPDGVYSVNATIYNASTSISVINASNLSTLVYFDGTAPIVFNANISNPASGSNYSGNLLINTSAIDATLLISAVRFNITNNSDVQNATVTGAQEGSSSKYTITINTSHYPDGYYNITVYANDTVNNLNNSARVARVIFDNTVPSITHTCDDYTVEEDDTITCSCSASDSLSKINTSYGASGVSFTANPSTTSTGTNLQTTCTSQDKANNLATSILYYNVSGISGSSGSSSPGSSGGSTTGSGANSTSNETSQNTTTNGSANLLQGNQQSQGTGNLKINSWIFWGIVVTIILIVVFIIILKKYISSNQDKHLLFGNSLKIKKI